MLAKNKDEEAIAIIDMVRETQEEVKHDIKQELHLQDFATKADLKEELHLYDFATKGDVREVKVEIDALKKDISAVKEDISAIKEDISAVKEDISAVKISIEKAKFSAVTWILTGLWGPLILAGAVWFLKGHSF